MNESMNESMNDEAVYRTAQATPGLLKSMVVDNGWVNKDFL